MKHTLSNLSFVTRLAVAVGLTTCACLVQAQPGGQGGPGGPRGGGRPPMPPIMKALDTDSNGEISASEITNAPAALKALDKNSDGKVTSDELMPSLPAGMTNRFNMTPPGAGQRPKDPLMSEIDTDGDGTLSATEIDNAATALKTLDTNSDGILSQDEIRPKRGPGGPGGPGGSDNAGSSDKSQ
jgi:Ca2+-binding EF-hand superfamily protein